MLLVLGCVVIVAVGLYLGLHMPLYEVGSSRLPVCRAPWIAPEERFWAAMRETRSVGPEFVASCQTRNAVLAPLAGLMVVAPPVALALLVWRRQRARPAAAAWS